MQLTDLAVIESVIDWLKQDKQVWLCTIVGTYGSAPRPIGSIFATNGVARAGSISGGCLEDEFIDMLAQGKISQGVSLFDYGTHIGAEGQVYELPCGGTIRLLIESVSCDANTLDAYGLWLDWKRQNVAYFRQIHISTGVWELQRQGVPPKLEVLLKDEVITLYYSQAWNVLLLGISQVSLHVANLARMAGYMVQICDTREELKGSWQYYDEQGMDICWQSPDQFVEQHANAYSVILALAHTPKIDDLGLMAALESNAFYIGAMGSKRTTASRIERLRRIGEFGDADIARLHAPIGLDIGSKTPAEIAISIMAEVIAKRNHITLNKRVC